MAYSNILEEDLEYSGPHVWPKITGERMSDLLIFKRPELAYLEALRRKKRLEEGSEPDEHILVVIRYKKYDEGEKKLSNVATATQKIWHHIKEDKTEDVRKLLMEMREVFERLMPDDPDPKVGVLILFFIEKRWKQALSSFQSRWI